MKKIIKTFFYISFLSYIFILISVLFLMSRSNYSSLSFFDYLRRYSNIIPFKTIFTYIDSIFKENMNADIPIKNLFGNLLLFFPLGLYLPYGFKRPLSLKNYTIVCALVLIFIEFGQVLLRRGSLDIDDFILNISGAIIGFAFFNLNMIKRFIHNFI